MKKLPTSRRKEALSDRARRYADVRNNADFSSRWENAFFGFQDGYRAAMRDCRRICKEQPYDANATSWMVRLAHWLRPLR